MLFIAGWVINMNLQPIDGDYFIRQELIGAGFYLLDLLPIISNNQRMKLPKAKCVKCGHEWTPRVDIVAMCPKCKTRKWKN